MDDEKLKYQIGANIAAYRKQAGLTQAGLAEKLNYSDKAVSKWERGESVPDVLTLMQLANQFDITVNDLLVDPEALPGNPGTLEKAMTQVSEKALKRKANKNVILALSSTLVWFVALFAFVVLSSVDFLEKYSCLLFFYAIPANAIVLEQGADQRHRLGKPSEHLRDIKGCSGDLLLQDLPAGHPGTDRHFPVVPDVPGQRREKGEYQWIKKNCGVPFGNASGL